MNNFNIFYDMTQGEGGENRYTKKEFPLLFWRVDWKPKKFVKSIEMR